MAEEKFSNFLTDIIDADLAEGKVDTVHTRFPPEPNGYLHIGSAKAIFINYTIAKHYGGKFNLRFDDTNPAREGDEYVQSILKDLHWLGADPNGGIFYGSDYFERCYEYAEKLIREGKAYVDDLTREEMQEYRGNDAGKPSRPSPYRDRTPEENLDLFRRMRAGEFADGEKTLRAKIDLASPNMNMRDPAIYRIKHVAHHRQGDKWCIYPLYDFAHPIQDAIEGITFSLCSLEFENHRPLYEWVITNIFGTEFPKQREFARLNVTNTVMSKRYLRELVEKNIVDGWDDPRMPTLSGLRRRGYTPTSIFTFVREAGISKADNLVDMRQLEAVLRSELELNAQRRVAVLDPVKLIIDNYPADACETFELPNNPNRDANDSSTRPVAFTREVWIDRSDFFEVPPPKFKRLTLGKEVRLMGAYLVRCTGVDKDEDGNITAIHAEADLETRNGNPADGRKVRGTIHWVSCQHCVEAEVRLYDKLFTEANMNSIPDDADFKDYLNPESVVVVPHAKLEESLRDAQPGERFQFVRTGYFTPDSKNPGVYNRHRDAEGQLQAVTTQSKRPTQKRRSFCFYFRCGVPRRNAAGQPAALFVVENEEQRSQPPGDGVAHLHRGHRVPHRHRRDQPEDAQSADADHRDKGGNAHIAAAAQRAGQDLDADVGHIGGHQHLHHMHAHLDHVGVLAEQAEQRPGSQVEHHADAYRNARRHLQADAGAPVHPVVLFGAEVLPRKGGDGNAQRVDGHPEDEVNLAVDAPGCDGVGAEAVHAALDHHVAHVVQRALGRRRDADGADGHENGPFHPQFARRQMPGHALEPGQAAQRQHRAGDLADHRGQSRPRYAPVEPGDEDHVQHDVDEGRHNEEVERTFGITRRPQDVGAHVIKDLGDHAQEVDAQIERRIPQDLRRGAHQPQNRLGGQQPQHGEQRADDHAEHQGGVHLPVHSVQVPGAVTLGHHHAGTAAKAHKQPHQQVDKGPGGAHRRQGIGAHKIADDQRVGGVVQLLEQRTEPDGQKENQQLPWNAAGQDIRLSDSAHNKT